MGKSTQERIRRRRFGTRIDAEMCQRWEWLLPDLFQKQIRRLAQEDVTDAIVMLEGGEDVTLLLSYRRWRSCMTAMGKAGHTSSIALTRVLGVQCSRRFKDPGNPNTIFRHLWHTWTSVCHHLE
jgi:hypothetical protein